MVEPVVEHVRIGGIVPANTTDWRGKVSMSIYLEGCPLKCPYCSNHRFGDGEPTDLSTVLKQVVDASKYVQAVVLSGGEPLMQPEACEQIAFVARKLGMMVALHTNGAYPERLRLLEDKLDAVMLDIKAPLFTGAYQEFTSDPLIDARVYQSLRICEDMRRMRKLEYFEVRTVVFPCLNDTPAEIGGIMSMVRPDAYYLVQGRPDLAPPDSEYHSLVHTENGMLTMAELEGLASQSVHMIGYGNVGVRGQGFQRYVPDGRV